MRHNESKLQINCVKWFSYQYSDYVLLSIPNGGKRNIREAQIMKAEGLLAGAADLFLAKSNNKYFGLFIEMKFGKGKQTESQKLFEKNVTANGYQYLICRSFEEFMNVINNYIKSV